MPQKILFCMTSNFAYDQRMQRVVDALRPSYQVYVFNRYSKESALAKVHDAACFFNKGVAFYIEFNLRLLLHLLTHRYDIIYLVDADTLLAGGISSWIKKIKMVFDSHEWFSQVPELLGHPLKQKIWDSIQYMFIKKMNLCITVNQSLSVIFSKAYNTPFLAIRNVPLLRVCSGRKDITRKIIIYQGAVNKGRGLEVAIEAMKSLPQFELLIYGEGGLSDVLRAKVQKEMLDDRVKFMGNQSPEILWQKTNEAYIGINLLEDESLNYYYSLANKFFDYMHAELPAIHMAFPEYIDILDVYEVGVALDQLECKKLIESIHMLDDIAYRQIIIDNCKKYKENFSWDKEQIKLIEAINGLANN